jgi:hypothetical protein
MPKIDLTQTPSETSLLALYQELCNGYRAIDDFRAKLLGLLPLATGAGVFILLGNITPETEKYLEPIGLFGFVITLGLFAYEIFGIRKCHALILAGKHIEVRWLNIGDGQFNSRPHSLLGFIDEPLAAGVIYPAVMGSWIYLALVISHPQASQPAALLVFFAGLAGMVIYDFWLRNDGKKFGKKLKKEIEASTPESS